MARRSWREAVLDRLGGPLPWLRKIVATLPDPLVEALTPKRSQAVALDLNGTVVDYLEYEGPDAYAPITTVVETEDAFYFGSLTEAGVGRLAKPKS